MRATLVCWLAFATADNKIETCANSPGSACSSSERQAQSAVLADYTPDDEAEQEEEDGADLIMHMQTRINVNIPLDQSKPAPAASKDQSEPVPAASKDAQSGFSLIEKAAVVHEETEKRAEVSLAEAAAKPSEAQHLSPPLAKTAPQVGNPLRSSVAGSGPPKAVGPAAHGASTLPADPAAFLTGYQLFLGAGLGAMLVIVGAVLATVLSSWSKDRKAASQDDVKAAGKAWMLDWALGYEPDADVAEEVDPKLELKLTGKKQPPICTDSDSGDTDEEEPEGESATESDPQADAVFVAQQVEVANEAMDQGYGIDGNSKLADAICVDLR